MMISYIRSQGSNIREMMSSFLLSFIVFFGQAYFKRDFSLISLPLSLSRKRCFGLLLFLLVALLFVLVGQ